ncbi:MAG: homocysteine S-methyltransferase family protein [Acetatifactor sp.]|nr:homocysteine S-methyltransferase family protein [Acetatifactor sp.]
MTFEEFQKLSTEYLYLDGATGSNLVKAGMPAGVCPEQWILEHREVLLKLQKQYVEAGADILYAPTFTANRIKLAEYGLQDELQDMVRRLTEISREAASCAGRSVYVAGDLTMTGAQLKPVGDMELEELISVYKEQILALSGAGVDLLAVETMMSLGEARAALIAAKEVCDLPVMVTMTFEGDGRTLYGTDAETAAVVLESLGACAIGVNCSAGPARMREIVSAMAGATRLPIVAKPNAGLPFLDEQGRTCYDLDAAEFTEEMKQLAEAGATVLGGCCGTTPEHIRKLRDTFGRKISCQVTRRQPGVRYLSSERRTVRFELDGGFLIIGERINPTGKKLLQSQLREGVTDRVLQFAEEQEQDGASVLDVNMGMSGIDEKAMMLRAVEEISGVTSLPLSLDSSHVEVLEAALRAYPGRALVNSVSMETEKLQKLLPLVKKYGAMFILLPLSDRGLPESMSEKISIIEAIYERAKALGLEQEDIVVDGLVTTVGANRQAALETLETIRYCRERGFATVCGLSNISFGMPERSYVNAAFLTLAIREGLTMAIANPSQDLLTGCALATDLLLAKEASDIRYIEAVGAAAERRQQKETNRQKPEAPEAPAKAAFHPEGTDSPCRQALKNAVLKGNRRGIAQLTRQALSQGEEPDILLNQVLLPAINQVGELFDSGVYFLPQLIGSAEAMKNSIEVLEPLLGRESDASEMQTVVIATVEGDIHDIGKNLVALMLKNHGFRVIDLGKDVPAEEIIRAAKENNAGIIALSALMTTTMQRMREVIECARREKLAAKIMIGGAVITREYADEIGADGYSRDAAEAVRVAKRLVEPDAENISKEESK